MQVMDKTVLILAVVIGAVAAFVGYFAALIDWLQDYANGTYSHNPAEALFETLALIAYTYLGVRFFSRHVNSFR